MATINHISDASVTRIGPVKPTEYSRGDGRRYQAFLRSNPDVEIPESVQITDVAQYEIECSWSYGEIYRARQQSWQTTQPATLDIKTVHSMLFLGEGVGTGRPNGSKILLTPGAAIAYYVLAWKDVFGYGIRENQLGRKTKDGWIVYAITASAAELAEIHEALYNVGVDY